MPVDISWADENVLWYTTVETPGGFVAVVLDADTGKVLYDAFALFATHDEAEADLLARLRDDLDDVVEEGTHVSEGHLDEETQFVYIPNDVMFQRTISIQVAYARQEEDSEEDET